MDNRTHVGFGILVVDDYPQYRAVPRTPTVVQIPISDNDGGLRVDTMLCHVCGDTLDIGTAATLGLGRLYEVVQLTDCSCCPIEPDISPATTTPSTLSDMPLGI